MRNLNVIIYLACCAILAACSTEPESLNYGKDACYSCKMTLMDHKFGAEIVTHKGKVYKFDDANCMINFFNSGEITDQDAKHILMVDFAKPSNLIDARNALF